MYLFICCNFAEEGNDYWALINVDLKVRLPPVLIKPEELKITSDAISEGNFGKVYKGELSKGGEPKRDVAVKTLKCS